MIFLYLPRCEILPKLLLQRNPSQCPAQPTSSGQLSTDQHCFRDKSLHPQDTVVVAPVLCRPSGPSPSLAPVEVPVSDVKMWIGKRRKRGPQSPLSKDSTCFVNQQHHRGRSKSGNNPQPQPVRIATTRHSTRRYLLTPIDQPQRQHEPPFPLPSRQNIPAAPTRAQIQKSSSHNQSPFGPRRHKKKRPSSANQSPSSPTRRQPPSPDHPDRSRIRRRSRSRGVCHRGIWRGRGLRSGFGVGSGGPGTPARLGVDPHLHERAHTYRTVLGKVGAVRGGCVCVRRWQAGG